MCLDAKQMSMDDNGICVFLSLIILESEDEKNWMGTKRCEVSRIDS